eukprot:jgi/Chlat1/4185/Chrsp27S04236
MAAALGEYTWIFGVATVLSFVSAFGIGANDIANAFASSVGSKALTMPQVILIASICEFSGAVLLGAGVTDTIKSSIARADAFSTDPPLLMYGMLCVLFAAAFWDNLACHLGLPVSTTHTTIGGVVGMVVVMKGFGAVVWARGTHVFPYFEGVAAIVASWVVSPLLAGGVVAIVFLLLRTYVLRAEDSFDKALRVLPFFIGVTFFVVTLFIIQTGNKNKTWHASDIVAAGISAGVAAGLGGISALYMPKLAQYVDSEEQREAAISTIGSDVEEMKLLHGSEEQAPAGNINAADVKMSMGLDESGLRKFWKRFMEGPLGNNAIMRIILHGARYKIHDDLIDDSSWAASYSSAEEFDARTERLFRSLQVFSAVAMSFAHGSNDTANAVGPYSAIYQIWRTGEADPKAHVPVWILAMGGAGIVVGLATFGHKIMSVLGVQSVRLSHSRGFCLELSSAFSVAFASRCGLPVSTTQTVAGAIVAIGMFEGAREGVNWRVMGKVVAGWGATIVVAGAVAGTLAGIGMHFF